MLNASEPKILVVEDDPQMRESLRALLSFYSFDIQMSINLQDAFHFLSDTVYDLILLDLHLNDQSGFEVMDYLEDNKLGTRVIIYTGEQSEKKAIKALKKGAIDYLKKPIDPDELIASINKGITLLNQQSEKKQLVNTIISSRERYRRIIDSQKDYVLLLSKDYKISFINRPYANSLGFNEPKELIGRFYKELINESAFNTLFGSLDAVRSSSTAMTVELQILDPNGLSRWQEWDFTGVFDKNGQLSEIQCIGRDVTQSKLRTKELEEKKEKFRKLAELTSDWLWEIDNNNVYTYVNPMVFDILGYRPEELLGKSLFDFMPAREAKRMKPLFQRLKAERKPLKAIEKINRHKNGSEIILETSGVPIFDQVGAVIGYRGIDRNVTTRGMAEKKLSEKTDRRIDMSGKDTSNAGSLIIICASCKKVHEENDNWSQIENYFLTHFNFTFSHGICPECAKKLYPELYKDNILP
ncbi:PAS domain S-box protein [Desulfosarcina sp.]|uniref:PAS domain-containing response regulator n=1 Tax=Desulfosarcina sp. TaxID=2027861 RepID=UPI0035674070